MAKKKLAVAQIYYKPAMIMQGHDLLIEPFGDTNTSISTLAFQGDSKLQRESKEAYLAWIKQKILSILRVAINQNVHVIVFPEYSIPVEIINDISAALQGSNTLVVAGTHMVTNDKVTKPKGYPPTKQFIRCAMCPIITSEGIQHFVIKTHHAGPEIGNIILPKNYIPQPMIMDKLSLHVKICIDAITLDSQFPDGKSSIIAIPSWSSSTEPFDALSVISKYNEWPVLYANCAEIGGSTISAPYLKNDAHWYLNAPLNNSIPRGTEGLVIANVDVDYSKHSVGTVKISPAATIEAVYNIFYRNNETHKKVMDVIDTYIDHFEEDANPQTLASLSDMLYSDKLRFLRQQYKAGILTNEIARECLGYVKVNAPSFKQIQEEQARNALKKIGAALSQSQVNDDFINTISSLSTKLKSLIDHHDDSENYYNDEQLFFGRDDEIVMVGKFINSNNKLLLLRGIKGIGKSKLLKKIENKVIPDTSPWDIKYIEFNQGIGYELLLDLLDYNLGLSYIERNNATPSELAKSYMSQIASKQATIIQFDDVHHLTEVNGKFSDTDVEEFFIELLNATSDYENVKIMMTTNRQIPSISTLAIQAPEISRLSNDEILTIIEYCYHKKTRSIKPLIISDATIEYIYGNPLTAIIVAQLVGADKLFEFETKGELFKKFQEQQIKNLLDEIELSNEEERIITIISIGKGILSIDFFEKNYPFLLSSVNQLVDRLMIENTCNELRIHPIFKDYYYNRLPAKDREEYHLVFSNYYETIYENKGIEKINPIMFSNLIYHLAGSMQTSKLRQYKLKYFDELFPIAHNLFREQRYDDALVYYELIREHIGQRKDIFIKMAQCYVYSNNIDKAEEYFAMAIAANPRGAYLYAKYSIALSSRRSTQKRAREIAEEAEKIYWQYGNTISWELAEIKYAQAKSLRNTDPKRARELYEEVCDSEKTNSYYLCMYAKFLFENHQPIDGKKILDKARSVNSNYHLYIRFVEKYVKKENDSELMIEFPEVDEETYEEDDLDSNSLVLV